MKTNYLSKALLLLLLFVGGLNVVVQAATVNIPTTSGQYISWNDATLTSCNVENSGANIGSTHNGSTAMFDLSNATQQDYYLTFTSGASGLTATVSWTLTDGGSYSQKKTFDISNTGSWTPSEKHGAWFTNVPTGSLTLTMKVESTTGSYAGNYGGLALLTTDGIPTIPGVIDIASGSYTGARLENSNTNVGWVSNGTSARYDVRVTQAGVYKMTIPMTRYGDGTITTTVTDAETGVTEAQGVWSMVSASNYEDVDVLVEGELTTGQKSLRMDFATTSSFLLNYKSFTMTRVADHFARISALTIAGQTVTSGDDSDWYCQLPAATDANVTFSIAKTGCTVGATATDGSSNNVAVVDNGDGTFTLAAPAPGTNTVVTLTLTPDDGALSARTAYTLKLFRIGEISLTGVTIDGIDASSLLSDLNSTQAATLGDVFTATPVVKATVVDGSVITGTPVVDGTRITYTLHAEMAGKTKDYTLTLDGLHIYNKEVGDETVQLKYTGEGNDKTNNIWSNGLYTLSPIGDGWNNSGFKMKKDATLTLTMPSDIVVKQFIIREFSDNYAPGTFGTLSSEGMTAAYIPYKHNFVNGEKYDMIVNLEGHQAGKDIVFRLEGGSQPTGWFELTIEKQAITTAPVVTGQQVTVVNNHAVVALTFDREMTTTTATINGGTVTAEGGSATLYFPVWNLDYSTNYTLAIAVGAAQDTYGNSNAEAINVAVNTGAKPVVEKAAYDYVVSTAEELKTAITAVEATNNRADAARKTIFLKNGDYDLGSSDGTVLWIRAYNLSLIGESRDGVVLHGTSSGISNPVLNLRDRTGFYLQDLTVRNDYDYGAPDAGNFKGVSVAVYGGDKTVMKNVRMLANQDTQVTGHRAYFEQCEIHGTVDFICGGGDNFYYQTDLVLMNRGGNVITAPSTSSALKWGYVFQHCTIRPIGEAAATTNAGSYSLGRPWQDTPRCYYLNTTMTVAPADNGWAAMGTLPTHFYEYNSMDADGNVIDLSVRGNSSTSTNSYTPVLTAEQAAKFTVENVLGGTDSWLPTEQTVVLSAPTATIAGMTLSWTDVEDARCYVVFKDGAYYANQTATTLSLTETGDYTVCAVNLYGGLGARSNSALASVATTASGWATACLPYDAVVPEGTKAYYVSASSSDAVTLTELTEIPAGEGFIYNAVEGSHEFRKADATPAAISNLLEGTLTEMTGISSGSIYVLGKNAGGKVAFMSYTGHTLSAGKAYLPAAAVSSGARSLNVVFGDSTTGIRVAGNRQTDAPYYDLQGRRIAHPVRGWYVRDGKKTIIK